MKQTQITITPEIMDLVIPAQKHYPRMPNTGELDQIQDATNNLLLALHWVVKLDWSAKHKIPASRKVAEALKPLGIYLHQTFLLCAAVHARQNALPDRLNYRDAGEWFALIVKGMGDEIVGTVLAESEPAQSTYKNDEKRSQLRKVAKNPRLVESGQNPLKKNHYLVALSDLIDAAIALGAESSHFKNYELKPFLATWKAALKEMDSTRWQRQYIVDGQLHRQLSNSRGSLNLSAKKKRISGKLAT
jgi:hypothetical protein